MSQYRIPILYGAAGIGLPGSGVKVTDSAEAQALIDVFGQGGLAGIDTSQNYAEGTSEKLLSQLNLHDAPVDTKIYPYEPGVLSTKRLTEHFNGVLERLGHVKIRIFYLHAPDHTVPIEETLAVVDAFYQKGAFKRFGLSNFKAFEVAEIYTFCKLKGYVLPTAYQGIYNAIDRTAEEELLPCLRKYNIQFAAYSPLAGGLLTGLHLDDRSDIEPGSHFDVNLPFGKFFTERYFKYIPTLLELRAEIAKHGLNLNDASVRWLQHHSQLRPSDLGIIYGGSKPSHIATTLEYNANGPLPQSLVDAYETAYGKIRGSLPLYNHDPYWWDSAKGEVIAV